MNVNGRIKHLRKNILKISQEEFSKKLNVSRSNIGNIEIGNISVTDRNIFAICNEFNVNENWLKNGVGDIFNNENNLDEKLKNLGFDDFGLNIAKSYLSLDENEKKAVQKFIFDVVKNNKI